MILINVLDQPHNVTYMTGKRLIALKVVTYIAVTRSRPITVTR